MPSDVEIVISALPRIDVACRTRAGLGSHGSRTVSEPQARILALLDPTDPTMVTELAEHLGVTASTMSLNLKRLRDAGLVSRQSDPADRRVANIRLTEEGQRVREALSRVSPERVAAMLGRLGPEERLLAVRGIALLADASDVLMAAGDG